MQELSGETGITPAYAGKSSSSMRVVQSSRDHPRVCGEKVIPCTPGLHIQGSPPRMRGKVLAALMPTNALGITPAYAGKSHQIRLQAAGRWDHPRVCGEKWMTPRPEILSIGSPPRMRGKEADIRCRPAYPRITPAYAGKSLASLESLCQPWDHPRVCGEKFMSLAFISPCLGSPPRMRGKEPGSMPCDFCRGITPAYAGKR